MDKPERIKTNWKKRTARITSAVINPFSVSFVMIVLLSFTSASSTSDAIKWSAIAIALTILPVFAVVAYLVRHGRIEGIFIRARKQRNKIYLLSIVCTAISCAVLYVMGAPKVLVASFVAGVAAMVIFMCINLWWKISVHTAFVTASVTVILSVYGAPGAITAALLPPTAWSRIELKHHSLAQVLIGAILAALVVLGVFYPLGLIGSAST